MLRKAVREFATKKIAPNADQWDAEHYFPYKEAIRPMGELGFFGTVIPEEYDGEDMGWLAAMIVTEEIARASSSCGCRSTCRCWAAPTPFSPTAARR
jgi:glutaryl-CoA dehydrogenase (non-decarboxylating)